MSILKSHMMVTKNPQNVDKKYFWTILVTFIFVSNFTKNISVVICEIQLKKTEKCFYIFIYTKDYMLTVWKLSLKCAATSLGMWLKDDLTFDMVSERT